MPLENSNPNSQIPPALRHGSINHQQQYDSSSGPAPAAPEPPSQDPRKHSKLRFWDHREKWKSLRTRHKIIVIVVALLVLASAGLAARILLSRSSEATIDIIKSQKKITTVASPLTGAQTAPELATRPVTGIMIENSPDARPQSGIDQAGVVFEAIAEGGITRFLTLYQDARPGYIGPVRSLRPYYIDWASSFDASIAHIGGSPEALSQIRSGGKDLDQFFNSAGYWREPSRPAPHDVYTSFDKLDALNKSKGYTSSTFTSWPRKSDQKLAAPTASSIDLAISSAVFNVHYVYDAAYNFYRRSEGGAAHLATNSATDKTGVQLAPKVVIAMVTTYSIVDDSGHGGYGTTGNGTVYVFQDGGVTQGTWSKADRSSQIVLKDSAGQDIKLNAGQTWVSVLGGAGKVTYAP